MNKFLLLFFVLFFLTLSFKPVFAQDEVKQTDYIVTGYCSVNDLKNNTLTSDWFVPVYAGYQPDAQVMNQIKTLSVRNYTFTLVMGTWCGDSKEHIPCFYKISDEAGFIQDDIIMICVDKQKLAGGIELSSLNIVKIPTFIVFLDDEEIGRIVETPAETLEKDLLNIFINAK